MASTPQVLAVDDEPEFLELMVDTLSDEGRFDVVPAESATGALETLEKLRVDCVVTDSIELDSGEPLVSAVRERDATMPLIYHTGKEWEAVSEEVVATGVSDYIQKGTGSLTEVARRVDVLVENDPDATIGAPGSDDGYSIPELDTDGGDWARIGGFDPEGEVSLGVLVADSVADYLDRSTESFSLYDSVDAEALERLVLTRRGGTARRGITVRFPVADHLVAVTSTGEVAIREQPLE